MALGLAAAGSVSAADLPKRKSGLWEITTASSAMEKAGKGAMTLSMCIDQNSDADWLRESQQNAQSKCSKQDYKAERDRVTFNSVCNFGQTTATTTGVASGDFDKQYKVETKSSYDPPLRGVKEASNTITAKWLGPCKAGQKPGDMVMPNGMTMNLHDMRRAAQK
jgi:hypothetical protein